MRVLAQLAPWENATAAMRVLVHGCVFVPTPVLWGNATAAMRVLVQGCNCEFVLARAAAAFATPVSSTCFAATVLFKSERCSPKPERLVGTVALQC